MSVVATPRAERRPLAASRSLAERLLAAVPLASIYVWLVLVYAWESWGHLTPWLFTDELELTQLSRSIAATGHAARRGEPHGFDSLYTLLIAPAWWIHDNHIAYDAVKYIGVIVMAAAVIPAYFLARMVVSRRVALVVAAATGTVPALAYSSFVVEETLAYPYSTLALFLVAKALLTRRRGWIAAAVIASLIAPFVRGELAVIPAVFLLGLLFMWWSSESMRRRRVTWSLGDWAGAIVLVIGAVIVLGGVFSHHSFTWFANTVYYKDRIWRMGLWAGGALTIGMAVLPTIAGVASLFRARGELRTRELRVFRSVLLAALIAFGTYAGIKASELSRVFATRVEERNLIYLAPLLLVGTGIWLDTKRISLRGLAVGAGLALYLVTTTPYHLDDHVYSDALGLAILEQANRYLYWDAETAKWVLVAVLVGSVALLLAPRWLGRRPRLAGGLVAAAAVLVIAWTVTAELSASLGSNSFSRSAVATLRNPLDWVDQRTKGAGVTYIGQGVSDQTPEWLLEFWNRSIKHVWSLDGTLVGPGPAGSPDVADTTGLLSSPDTPTPYVVEEEGVEVAGRVVGSPHAYRAGGHFRKWRLVKVEPPIRLKSATFGLYPDGWSGQYDTAYNRYSEGTGGKIRVKVSRAEWGGPQGRSPVTISVGTLVIGKDHQPHLGQVTWRKRFVIDSKLSRTFTIPAPADRFRVAVAVRDKIVPRNIDPLHSSDGRALGAVVTYTFVPRDAAQR